MLPDQEQQLATEAFQQWSAGKGFPGMPSICEVIGPEVVHTLKLGLSQPAWTFRCDVFDMTFHVWYDAVRQQWQIIDVAGFLTNPELVTIQTPPKDV